MLTKAEEKFIWKIVSKACKKKSIPYKFNQHNEQLPLQAKTSLLSTIRTWLYCISQTIHTAIIGGHIYFIIRHADLTSLWDLASILFNMALFIYNSVLISTFTVIAFEKFGIASLYNQIQFINRHFGKQILKTQYVKCDIREKLIIGFIYMSTIGLLVSAFLSPFLQTNLYWYYYNVLPESPRGIILWCMFGIAEYYFWCSVITANWFIQLNGVTYVFTIMFWLKRIS